MGLAPFEITSELAAGERGVRELACVEPCRSRLTMQEQDVLMIALACMHYCIYVLLFSDLVSFDLDTQVLAVDHGLDDLLWGKGHGGWQVSESGQKGRGGCAGVLLQQEAAC